MKDLCKPDKTDFRLLADVLKGFAAFDGGYPVSWKLDHKLTRGIGRVESKKVTRIDSRVTVTETVAVVDPYGQGERGIAASIPYDRQRPWAYGLRVRVEETSYTDYPVCEYLVTVENILSSDSVKISNVYPIDAVLPGANAVLRKCNGDSCVREGYETTDVCLAGHSEVISPVGGRSCDGAFPYFRVLCDGFGYNLAIGWPGQWQAEFEGAENGFRFAAKQQDTNFVLHPGEIYRAPRITIMAFAGGEERGRILWRRWYRDHIRPRSLGDELPPMLCCVHPAGDEEFTHSTEENQLEAIDTFLRRGLHPDVWWIDAGWYPCKDSEGIRRWWRTGNWKPDPERYPNGLGPVGKKCEENDIRFLLWFEPERVKLAYKQPDLPDRFLLKKKYLQDGELVESEDALLNLGDPECRKWLTDHVDGIIKEGHISIYRQDFNFEPLDYWRQADTRDRIGMTENLHVQGYLAYWDALLERNPGLLIDSCASGGRRNDLETMRRSVTLHPTDYGYGEPLVKQAFFSALHTWIPYYRACGLMAGYEPGSAVNIADEVALNSYMLHNNMGHAMSCPVMCDVDESYLEVTKKFVDRVWRPLADLMIRGDYYPLTEMRKSDEDWMAEEFYDPADGTGAVHLIRNAEAEAPAFAVTLRGLDGEKTYRFTNPESGETFDAKGSAELRFTLDKRSAAAWFFRAL